MAEKRAHFLVSNRAFTTMTGVRKVCADCGAPDPKRGSECPGRRPAPKIVTDPKSVSARALDGDD